MYSPPQGGPSITGTVLEADGSYWYGTKAICNGECIHSHTADGVALKILRRPPFYQVSPDVKHNGGFDSINTTAEYLTKLKKEAGTNYITASAV